MVTHGDAHVLLAVETTLARAVAHEDVVFLEHAQDKGLGREGRQNLHKEVVGLRGNDTQEGDGTQFGLEVVAFLNELVASTFVLQRCRYL